MTLPVSVRNAGDTGNLTGVTAIAVGGSNTCALLTGGTVQCWGDNSYGQLGNNSTNLSKLPVSVRNASNTEDLLNATAVAASLAHTCATVNTGGGQIQCWGRNIYVQLGNGALFMSNVPIPVVGIP